MSGRAATSLIRVKTIIGWPAPNKMGTSKAHGSPLGEDEVRLAKEALGWDPDAHFLVPDGVYEAFSAVEKGAAVHAEWTERYLAWRDADEDRAAEWDAAWRGEPLPGFADVAADVVGQGQDRDALGGPAGHGRLREDHADDGRRRRRPQRVDEDRVPGRATSSPATTPGRNVFFGVREHGMGGTVNGLAAHGGIVRPYGSTFLQFADYMRGSIRLSALMGLPVTWVFTHDSVALGEDGPTHQPVEHLAALRAIPGLVVLRPADAHGDGRGVARHPRGPRGPGGAHPVAPGPAGARPRRAAGPPRASRRAPTCCATPTIPRRSSSRRAREVWVALEAADLLDFPVRVVSMP